MEDLPVEVKALIYKKLDTATLLEMKFVNLTVKEEINSMIDFNPCINTDEISTHEGQGDDEDLQLQPIFQMRAKSVKFHQSPNYDQGLGFGFAREEPLDLDLLKVFRFPEAVRSLEFRGHWSSGWDFGTSGIMDFGLIFKVLEECQRIEKLSVKDLKLYGEPLTPEQCDEFIVRMGDLQSLELSFNESYNPKPPELLPLPFISKILNHYYSPVLTSISSSLIAEHYQARESSDDGILLNSWVARPLKLAARHWKTLKELTLTIVCDGSYSNQVEAIGMDIMENLSKIQNLMKFEINGAMYVFFLSGESPSKLYTILMNLVKQQKALEILVTPAIGHETLTHVILNNYASLKSLDIRYFQYRENLDHLHLPMFDMELFSNCRELEFLSIRNVCGRFGIINLGSLSPEISCLNLSGFGIPSHEQLLQCSERCINLKSVKFDFEPSDQCNFSRLSEGILSLIRNSESLIEIKLIVQRFSSNRDPFWDDEFLLLCRLFNKFSGHFINRRFQDCEGRIHDCMDSSDVYGRPGLFVRMELCTFTASSITLNDRNKVLSNDEEV